MPSYLSSMSVSSSLNMLAEAIETARRKAFVIVDDTLLRTNQVGMTSGRDRPFYSGKLKRHGGNVQVLADPAGRLIGTSPALPRPAQHGSVLRLGWTVFDRQRQLMFYWGCGGSVQQLVRRRRGRQQPPRSGRLVLAPSDARLHPLGRFAVRHTDSG